MDISQGIVAAHLRWDV